MPLAGLVLNRASRPPEGDLSADRAMRRRRAAARGGRDVTGGRDDGRAAAAARRPGAHRRARDPAARPLRDAVTPTLPRPSYRRWPPTCTTSTGCARSATCSQASAERWLREMPRSQRAAHAARTARSAVRCSGLDGLGDAGVIAHRGLEQRAPRGDVRALAEEARRSRSVIPPHTPHSISLSSASARHSVRTGHPAHSCLARCCAAPRTNSSSGADCLHSRL